MWEVASGKVIRTFKGHTGTIAMVVLLADDNKMCSLNSLLFQELSKLGN
jgi:hypothetical protein